MEQVKIKLTFYSEDHLRNTYKDYLPNKELEDLIWDGFPGVDYLTNDFILKDRDFLEYCVGEPLLSSRCGVSLEAELVTSKTKKNQ